MVCYRRELSWASCSKCTPWDTVLCSGRFGKEQVSIALKNESSASLVFQVPECCLTFRIFLRVAEGFRPQSILGPQSCCTLLHGVLKPHGAQPTTLCCLLLTQSHLLVCGTLCDCAAGSSAVGASFCRQTLCRYIRARTSSTF